ncbi:hypothetical protein AB0K60_20650 [Thermopolyspora sp. NPDC052614]|uniref:hypothetical protein n=1 Tax=Thermopolyspora sp. NPDC052614 TaxID=3155682 RepID=UPI00341F4C68
MAGVRLKRWDNVRILTEEPKGTPMGRREVSLDKGQLLSWDRGRVFLDIARRGCGSACRYCYISAPEAPQEPATPDDVLDAAERLTKDDRYQAGARGTVISLSPNSEPFRSAASTLLVMTALSRLLVNGNPIQIPTKESVPAELLRLVDAEAKSDDQVVFFISLATMNRAESLEPGAAAIEDRLANAARLRRHRCRSCAYIKPFLKAAIHELGDFAARLRAARFDCVCVGMRYRARLRTTADVVVPVAHVADRGGTSPAYETYSRPHPVHSGYVAERIGPDLRDFYETLRTACAPTPVFLTSTCVSSFLLDREPPLPVWRELPQLCVNCRSCGQGVGHR